LDDPWIAPVLITTTRIVKYVLEHIEAPVATIVLNDAATRNALSLTMFDALDDAFARLRGDGSTHIVLLRGEGPAFCAGFDLAAAADEPELLPTYIRRLSTLLRAIRRLPQIVVAAVEGAAIAGGCAMLSACDFVFVAPDAKLGYPVHALGISPAVTIATLRLMLGDGAARALLMSGEIVSGAEAFRRGLATHIAQTGQSVDEAAAAHCRALALKGSHALRTTKAWLNELDGSNANSAFDLPAQNSAEESLSSESRTRLAEFWSARKT
jgi:methylglutaconyl-CoA hydratase